MKKQLSNEELNVILPMLIKLFKKTFPGRSITAPEIVKGMNRKRIEDGKFKSVFTEAMLRRLTNHIRTNGILPLIADIKGYYLSDNITDIDAQIQSLEDRIEGMRSAIDGLKGYKVNLQFEAKMNDPFGIDWN
jgi:hypothetical protein